MPLKNAFLENPQPAKTLLDLLAHDDREFVTCAYMTLLGRLPDPQGLSYYLDRLNRFDDKLAIIYQVYKSTEARGYKGSVAGMESAMRLYAWKKVPILGFLFRVFDQGPDNFRILCELRSIRRRIDCLENGQNVEHETPKVEAAIDEMFASFDPQGYLKNHPDVVAAGINPYEHFMQHGWWEGRLFTHRSRNNEIGPSIKADPSDRINGVAPYSISSQPMPSREGGTASKDVASYFMEPADEALQDDDYTFTRLMHYLWTTRLDLQSVFDIHTRSGRFEFAKWFLCSASREYGLTPTVYPQNLLEVLSAVGGEVGGKAKSMLDAQARSGSGVATDGALASADSNAAGANLIGYAFGEFGMGEHVRMVARALNTSDFPFCVIDQDVGLHGAGDGSVGHWVTNEPRYGTNIFHVNADVFPPLYFKFGEAFFAGRYNIGYWAWELSECPPEFDLALSMVDEVWAISDFVAESFKTRAQVPVTTMPLAVTVPNLDAAHYTKAYFGLPADKFIYFFTFDAASYLDRKNPIAVVQAFRLAFPRGDEKVHLLLKTMNIDVAGPLWGVLLEEIDGDPRITVMGKRLTRDEVLGLYLACDAFVSLHRSEGFGRCVAEAMAYGKPVIVTNYSGTRDFAFEGTAFVVDYRLIPVPEGAYPFWKDQVWAEPDIKHAAVLMQKLLNDEKYRTEIAEAGKRYVLDNLNESAVGRRYVTRLGEIQAMRTMHYSRGAVQGIPPENRAADSGDEITGNVDFPMVGHSNQVSEAFAVEGWVFSAWGIGSVDIHIDAELVDRAHYGILRQDVFEAYPHMENAAKSGFCCQIDISKLSLGKHTLRVSAKSRSGNLRSWEIEFALVKSTRYVEWLKKNDEISLQKWRGLLEARNPISLIIRAAPDFDGALLGQTLGSLAAQIDQKFEIIIVSDGTRHEEIRALVAKAVLSEKTQFERHDFGDWTSRIAHCRGVVVGLLDVGDVLRPWALSVVDDVISANDEVDLLYADEDSISDEGRTKPIFKPAWSPLFLDHHNYIGRPWFAKKDVMRQALTAIASDANYLDEHVLLRELGSLSRLVCHIPSVLVSRAECAIQAGKIENGQIEAALEKGPRGKVFPKVSIIIPTCLGDVDLFARCLSGIMNTTDYPDIEVIIVVNNLKGDRAAAMDYLNKWPFKVIYWDKAFSWSEVNNFGAEQAAGDFFLFMNDDIEPLDEGWLKAMVRTLDARSVGVVGPLLKYPNNTIQHMGMNFVPSGSGVRHLFRFCRGTENDLQWLMNYAREVSAVTGACLLTTRECFTAMQGFDADLPLVCNDTDYCIRARMNGYAVIIQPTAKLIHHEGVSRAGLSEVEDVDKFWAKWGKLLKAGDPFTNPNLDSARDDWVVNPVIQQAYEYRVTHA